MVSVLDIVLIEGGVNNNNRHVVCATKLIDEHTAEVVCWCKPIGFKNGVPLQHINKFKSTRTVESLRKLAKHPNQHKN